MRNILMTLFVVASISFAGSAGAQDSNYMRARMWERQENGIQGVLDCFKNDCPPVEYREYLLQIVSAETNLIVYGVSPKDERLVSPLASDVKSMADFPAFAYKLFKKRMRETTGFTPDSADSFKEGSFRIYPKNDPSQKLTLNFNN